MSEQELKRLEDRFPSVSGQAFAVARRRVLESGQGVLQVEDGKLVRVFKDGRREFIKDVPPSTPAKAGTKFSIR